MTSETYKEAVESPEKTETKPQSDVQPLRNISAVRGLDEPTQKPAQQEQSNPQTAETVEKESSIFQGDKLKEMRANNPEKETTFAALDEHFGENDAKKFQIAGAGTEIPELVTINKTTHVFRYHDGTKPLGDDPKGCWVSPIYYPDIKDRQQKCALPEGHTGVLADDYVLMPGTRVLSSKAHPIDGRAGLGTQFYVLDLDKMKEV